MCRSAGHISAAKRSTSAAGMVSHWPIEEHAFELRHRGPLEPHEAKSPPLRVKAILDVRPLGADDAVAAHPR